MEKKGYIERGALDTELQNLVREYNRNCESDKSYGVIVALCRLRLFPAADVVEVVHGEWEESHEYSEMYNGHGYDEVEHLLHNCSVCNYQIGEYASDYHFCPWCGAKMDGRTYTLAEVKTELGLDQMDGERKEE